MTEIAYVVHTDSGIFMLDEQGVCRWAVAPPGCVQVPDHIVHAQYVATLDVREPGGLVALPRIGCPLLFAATDPTTGRIRLVRTPPLLRFEDRRATPPPGLTLGALPADPRSRRPAPPGTRAAESPRAKLPAARVQDQR